MVEELMLSVTDETLSKQNVCVLNSTLIYFLCSKRKNTLAEFVWVSAVVYGGGLKEIFTLVHHQCGVLVLT